MNQIINEASEIIKLWTIHIHNCKHTNCCCLDLADKLFSKDNCGTEPATVTTKENSQNTNQGDLVQ